MATKKKTNKSAWIRSQPASMSAADVVSKAKKEGITLTSSQVYTARSTGKGAKPKATQAPKSAAVSSGRGTGNGSIEDLIRAIVNDEIKAFFNR